MSNIPTELKYTRSHEWCRTNPDGTVTIGITEHAEKELGDLVFVELPEVGQVATSGEEAGVVESVKAASDIYFPINGEVVEINDNLSSSPSDINSDPYGSGWICKLQPNDESELKELLDDEAYHALID